MSRGLPALIALCVFLPRASDAAEFYEESNLEASGDTLTVFLPLSAMVISFAKRDWPGSIQLAKSIVGTQIVVESIKRGYLKARPNAASLMSFPSGHAAGAFSGAAFISQRYDFPWWVDTIYWGGAAWTAYTRVDANKHHLDDVLMGGTIAVFMNWFFVRPQDSKVALMPMATSAGYGLSLSWGGQVLADPTGEPPSWERRYRLELGFGSAWQTRNWVTSPAATGTPVDFSDVGFQASRKINLYFEVDGMALGSSHFIDAVAGFRWQIDSHWDAGISYRLIDRHLGGDAALRNTLTLHWPLFVFATRGSVEGSYSPAYSSVSCLRRSAMQARISFWSRVAPWSAFRSA